MWPTAFGLSEVLNAGMLATSHLVVGFSAAVICARFSHVPLAPVALLVTLVGSLSPDIDGGGSISRPGKYVRGIVPNLVGTILDLIGVSTGAVVRAVVSHRGLLHWPAVPVLLYGVGVFYQLPLLCWFAIGYLSHLLADLVTVGGIPFFAPVTLRKFSLSWFRTGSMQERLLVILLIAILIYWDDSNAVKFLADHIFR